MRFWFEHSSDVPLREQIVTQITLGILSGELTAGDRLPSIRDLARRFGLHANTVSAGYRQLEAEGWVQARRGSGCYVLGRTPETAMARPDAISCAIASLFQIAARTGISAPEVAERVRQFADHCAIERILVEPDEELRRIVAAELTAVSRVPVEACEVEACSRHTTGALVTLPSKLHRVRSELAGRSATATVHALRVRSVPVSLAGHLPPPDARANLLVGIASGWPEFLRFARTMLVAAGFAAEALLVRDARQPGWQDGLDQAAAVVCDLCTERRLNQTLPAANTIVSSILNGAQPDALRPYLHSGIL